MGRLPSHIFVVRHGNRLDTANKQWHLTSPTPYDPPLTYGGFLQARQVGNQIGSILEQAKVEAEVTNNGAALTGKRRRFRVVIHSSPFLRCVQTSVGISSGLAQTAPESIYQPSDVIVPRRAPIGQQSPHKSALLRLDTFLGEWLSPEYFEMITPPPGPALMMGSAKAELLRREDYSIYTDVPAPASNNNNNNRPTSKGALWSSPVSSPVQRPASPTLDQRGNVFSPSAMTAALSSASTEQKKGYVPPRPLHAISSNGKIPDGFVAHARDSCVVIDYQWDSMRPPLDFGDGGKLPEEWTSMHQRFRSGLKKMVNWYATTECPDELLCPPVNTENDQSCSDSGYGEEDEEEVETVVIIVSHGAGCNALIGAITHQPVLMDVGIASITAAVRKPDVNYAEALALASGRQGSGAGPPPMAAVDDLYEIRLSASTEHLRSNSGASISAKPASSPKNTWSPSSRRGRTSALASSPAMGGPVQSPFTFLEPLSSVGSRSTSANASMGHFSRRDSGSSRQSPRLAPSASASASTGGNYGFPSSSNESSSYAMGRGSAPSPGLWAPARSTLRLIDDIDEEAVDDYDSMLPDFDNKRFRPISEESIKPSSSDAAAEASEPFPSLAPAVRLPPAIRGPIFSAPIKLNTDLAFGDPVEEMPLTNLSGLWSLALPPAADEADTFRDLSQTKRRWTVNERV